MSKPFEGRCQTLAGDRLVVNRLTYNGAPAAFSVLVDPKDGAPQSAHLSIEDARRLFSWLGVELHRWAP